MMLKLLENRTNLITNMLLLVQKVFKNVVYGWIYLCMVFLD
jgi:hypothetical protein